MDSADRNEMGMCQPQPEIIDILSHSQYLHLWNRVDVVYLNLCEKKHVKITFVCFFVVIFQVSSDRPFLANTRSGSLKSGLKIHCDKALLLFSLMIMIQLGGSEALTKVFTRCASLFMRILKWIIPGQWILYQALYTPLWVLLFKGFLYVNRNSDLFALPACFCWRCPGWKVLA